VIPQHNFNVNRNNRAKTEALSQQEQDIVFPHISHTVHQDGSVLKDFFNGSTDGSYQ
jgi:hypothetical protein